MLAVLFLSALMGLAIGDPLPPVRKHTEIIHVPAPKPVVRHVPALQEHPKQIVQHVPIRQTVVKEINVPRDIIREVPVIVEKKLILRQPHIRKFPIDVKKTLLQPHIKHVPQVRVNYRKKPYEVWHTKEVKKIIKVPRPYPVIKHKIVTKVLNRVVDVPHKVYKDKVKVVQVPQPFKVQKVHHRKIDVPIEVRVPVPRVNVKRTQEVQKVPIDVTVVKKVGIPRKTTLTEIVPVPVKPEGCGPDGVDCGSFASAGSVVTDTVGVAGVAGAGGGAVVEDVLVGGSGFTDSVGVVDQSVAVRGGVRTIVDEAVPVVPLIKKVRKVTVGPAAPVVEDTTVVGGGPVVRGDVIEGRLYGPDLPGLAPGVGPVVDPTFIESSVSGGPSVLPLPAETYVPGADSLPDVVAPYDRDSLGPLGSGSGLPLPDGRVQEIYNERGVFPGVGFQSGFVSGGYDGGLLDGAAGLYSEGQYLDGVRSGFGNSFELRSDGFGGGFGPDADVIERARTTTSGGGGGIVYQERRSIPILVGGDVQGRIIKTDGGGYGPNYDDSDNAVAVASASAGGLIGAAPGGSIGAAAGASAAALASAATSAGVSAGQLGLGFVNQGGHFNAGIDGHGAINAPYPDHSLFGGDISSAQAQAQAQVFAQAQNFAHAQAQNLAHVQAHANNIGDSLHSDLQLANNLAFGDNYDVNKYA
ncbi:uncharacterized protein LOC133201125 [Saccostrea echinata]|uniref:uncharacterized protein LOC133201125 n=1 Tax=Saccostrea echinata TaxID=191078 RepID=UPI002A7F238D|nr:uncharacterized protein LOC133201125 [Saccostrea echinata]